MAMGMMVVHDIIHRTVDEETLRRLIEYIRRDDVRKNLEDTGWWAVTMKAMRYLRENPVAVEHIGDRRYMVEVPSKSEPGEVWHASRYECECTGNRRHRHCYHRVLALLLPIIDRIEGEIEAERAERARRKVVACDDGEGGIEYELSYDGVFLGYAPTEDVGEARIMQYVRALERRARRAGC